MELHILHTNDVHSELTGYARLAQGMRALRKNLLEQGHAVLSFDLGDHIDMSNPLSYATGGRINADILRAMQYDGWVLGNNETVTVEQHLWADLIQATGCPLYCSNVEVSRTKGNLRSGGLISWAGIRVGVFGVSVRYEKLLHTLGVLADDPLDTAWAVAESLRAAGADVVILLSHLGLHVDEVLANAGLPVDVIVGSHTHQFLESGLRRGNVWIFQAGKHARAFGHITLELDSHARIAEVRGNLVYTDPLAQPDPAVAAAIRRNQPIADRFLRQPIARLPRPVEHDLFAESELANLLCDRMRTEFAVDLAIVNGGVVTAALRAGVVCQGDLLSICATPMRPVLMAVAGADLQRLFDESMRMDVIGRQGIGFGFRGYYIGRLHVSGGVVYVRTTRENDVDEERMARLEIGGKPVRPEALYRIAVCEYVALSPMFPALKDAEYTYLLPTLRSILERGLKSARCIDQARVRRYLPEDAAGHDRAEAAEAQS